MKDVLKLLLVLTLICFLAGLLLAMVNKVTEDPIRRAQRAEKMEAIRKVLPPCDNRPDEETVTVSDHNAQWTFYVARRGGQYAGAAFEASSDKGYGGTIRVMVGVNADGTVNAIEILSHKETPGLGARISEPAFKNRFAGRDIQDTTWAVRKDGGDIDEITAATISSRAVVGAVADGLAVYQGHAATIEAGGN